MTTEKVMELVKSATTKKQAREAIKAYEQFKDEHNCCGPQVFTWAEMNAIDRCFDMSL